LKLSVPDTSVVRRSTVNEPLGAWVVADPVAETEHGGNAV
jgi:hypothetical protein